MNIANCRQCGRIFNTVNGSYICPVCKKEIEEKFDRVKDYLKEYPNATIANVSEENDVSLNQLHQWIREERLIMAKIDENRVICLKCGDLIENGKYCQKCKDEMADALNRELKKGKLTAAEILRQKQDESQAAKMRFLDKRLK